MNVILVCCDTWRRDHLGCYGNSWIQTPNLDRLAREGTVFENAYCGSFPTLPCRNEILTGQYQFPWRGWAGPDPAATTLSGLIADSGRVSYLITDIYHHWRRGGGTYWWDFSGFELIRGQERDRWITDGDVNVVYPAPAYETGVKIGPHLKNAAFVRRDEEDWFAPQVFSRAIRWIQHNAGHQDFFLMIDGFDPHEPWDPPDHYTALYGDPDYKGHDYVAPEYGRIEGYLTQEEFARVKALYAGEITMVDAWIGRLLDQVERMGILDDTLILFMTDHGTYQGDHGQVGKLQSYMYQGISHIPMIARHPQLGRGQRLPQLVQPVDIFSTTLEAVGVEAPDGVHGHSLIPLLRGDRDAATRQAAIFGRAGSDVNVTDGEYTLYHHPKAGQKRIEASGDPFLPRKTVLFHLPSDPEEENELAQSRPEEVERLQRLRNEQLEAINAPAEMLNRLR
jgi:arylsulfatase A-like enzyme